MPWKKRTVNESRKIMFVKVVCGPAYVFYFATTRGVEDGVALLQLGCPFLSVLVLLEHFRSFWTAEQSSSVLLQRKKDSISRVKSSEASATAYPNFFIKKTKGPCKGMKKRNWVLSSQSEISSPSPGTTPLGTTRPSQQACATHQSGDERMAAFRLADAVARREPAPNLLHGSHR